MRTEIEPGYYEIDNFEDVRSEYEALFSSKKCDTLYKVRNWRERYHPEFLTKGELYFSRPSELNDPFDIHRPVKFDSAFIDSPEFLKKMVDSAPEFLKTNPGRDSEIAVENYIEKVIKPNPEGYFMRNYGDMMGDHKYDNTIGVLSLTSNIEDEQLWGYYGGGLKGFAVGFDPMKLSQFISSLGSFINYDDTIKKFDVINRTKNDLIQNWFEKGTKWSFESEFRFVKMIDDESKRLLYFPPEIVTEIVLGPRIPKGDSEAILKVFGERYPSAILRKVVCDYARGTIEARKIS